ncbi:hypothetical protein F4781DRAFT_392863 [Annulohypoxylon bovei var. microspora]|nr:hypothetical protein F4781DRAFT_392863 [Annulohypoxylon bovei var. microspora]
MSWNCRDCPRRFDTWQSRDQHAAARGHKALDFECRSCNTFCPNEEERRKHEAEEHNYCADCKRPFQSPNNLKMHLNSRTHRGANLKCPFCKTGHTSATGLAHHLERGRCPRAASLNRDAVYKAVASKDPDGLLAKKLIGWHGSPTYEAGPKSWNGEAWQCYLCRREFRSLPGLNQHLGSPVHQQALYHCPNRNGCGREYKTLAAVMNHLESESCAFMRFEAVQSTVGNLVSGDRRLTFG